MATSSTSITSLQAVKRYLRLTTSDDDRLLTELLNAATDRIEHFCQRTFVTASYKEFISGSGTGTLLLPNYPVTAIRRIGWDRNNALSVSATTSSDLRATVEVQNDQIVLNRYDSSGSETATSLTFASNVTTSAMATAITAVSGWSATADTNVLCDELVRQGGQDALTNSAQLYFVEATDAEYRVDEETGRIDLLTAQFEAKWYPFDPNALSFPRGSHNIFVDYDAGFTQATVPEALQEIAWELVASAYHGGKHDPTVASESLDGYSYSTRNAIELRDDQMRRMYIYRRNAE
tara:strand:- start:3515 stop:4390 length:876 start_codon:yes stop_codon:yes gene_type:complete